jgi:ankyrin repeat protein
MNSPNSKNDDFIDKLIEVLVNNRNKKIIIDLLKTNTIIDIQNKNGITPLMLFSYYGHLEFVQELLEAGAVVDISSIGGNTALKAAVLNGHIKIVALLLKHGAKVDIQNSIGETVIISASIDGYIKIVQELLKYGATVDVKNKFGDSAFDSKNKKVIKLLNKQLLVPLFNKKQKKLPKHIIIESLYYL